jgi:hypothetical protein
MIILHCDEKTGRSYWSITDDSNYIEPVHDEDNCICYFSVWFVPQYGGKPILDCHCNSFIDAIRQLEVISV